MKKNFSLREMVVSSSHPKLLPTSIPISVADNLMNVWFYILQPLREAYGKPIVVTSGYRPTALNSAVGGVKNSQHLTGEAVDIVAQQRSDTDQLGKLIESLHLPFDQLIYEGTWIHVSYSARQRRQIIKARRMTCLFFVNL